MYRTVTVNTLEGYHVKTITRIKDDILWIHVYSMFLFIIRAFNIYSTQASFKSTFDSNLFSFLSHFYLCFILYLQNSITPYSLCTQLIVYIPGLSWTFIIKLFEDDLPWPLDITYFMEVIVNESWTQFSLFSWKSIKYQTTSCYEPW